MRTKPSPPVLALGVLLLLLACQTLPQQVATPSASVEQAATRGPSQPMQIPGSEEAGREAAPAPSSDWETHRDPLGFSVSNPQGWSVRVVPNSGRVEISGLNRERVVIWPVFARVQLQAATARAVLQAIGPALWPRASWDNPQALPERVVRMTGRDAGDRGVIGLYWVNSPKGSAAFVYLFSAPALRYAALADTFVQIASSFQAWGAPVQGPDSNLRYVRFEDPRERAFSLQVPADWQVTGGLFRFATVDVRSMVNAVSPDEQVFAAIGDADIPPFVVPSSLHARLGLREGDWYSPGYNVRMLIMHYMPGVEFARNYVNLKYSKACSNLAISEARDLPEASRDINALYARYGLYGIDLKLSFGDAAFTCTLNRIPLRGYYFAGIQSVSGTWGTIWNMQYLLGYRATADRVDLAQTVLARMIRTFEVDPDWYARQQQVTRETSRVVSETSAYISQLMNDSYWYRQSVMDELDRRRSNVILGTTDVIDPVTGKWFKVENGSNYYWLDPNENIVGTNTYTKPGIDFREMIQLP